MVRATACIIRSWRSSPPNPTEQEDKDLLGAHPQNNSAVCGQEQDHEEDYQREKSVEPGAQPPGTAPPWRGVGGAGLLQDPILSVSVRVDPYSTFHRTELNFSWQPKHRYLIVVHEGRQ